MSLQLNICSDDYYIYHPKNLAQSWHKVGAKLHKVGSVLPMTTGVPYDKIELSEGEGAFRKQKILGPTHSKNKIHSSE